MPIHLPHTVRALSEKAFHEPDYSVMALAFEAHNELGGFYNETIYKCNLLQKCRDNGFETECEFEVRLTDLNYTRSLLIDLLINGTVYELKTIRSIQEAQRIQALNLKKRMIDVLNDWGAFFDTHLYEDALIHLLGGEQEVVQPIEIKKNCQILGRQKLFCLSGSEFFRVTAAKGDTKRYEAHLIRLLHHTPFSYLHWINLNRSTVQFTTLEKESFCSNYSVT